MPVARKSARATAAPARKASRPRAAAKRSAGPQATAAAIDPPKPQPALKTKVLRDTFRMPSDEYAVIDALKQRAAGAGRPARKSDVLRAGVQVLASMGDGDFIAALRALPPLKPARPAKS